jgi:hypothetical protein
MRGKHYASINNLKFNHVYDDHIERVFELYKSPKHFQQIHHPFMTGLQMKKGNSLIQIGSNFNFKWKEKIFVESEVVEVINEQTYKMIKLCLYDIKDSANIYFIYFKLNWLSTDNATLLTHICEFQTAQQLSIIQLHCDYKEKMLLFENSSKYLKTLTHYLEQSESIVLDIGLKRLWEIITDIKGFAKHVPILADSIEERDNNIRITKDNLVSHFKVTKKHFNEEVSDFVIQGVCTPGTVEKEMWFTLISLDNSNKCLLIMRHVFYNPIPVSCFDELSHSKQVILKNLKNALVWLGNENCKMANN